MFGFGDAQDDYQKANDQNQPELSHEVLAGAASFMAMKEWEDHQRSEGKEVDHSFAKEALAGFAGVEVDRLAETKGADYIDREKAKHAAKKKSEELYDQHYGQDPNYNPERRGPHRHIKENFDSNNGNW